MSLYDAICSCHLLMYMIYHQINYLPSTLSLKSSNKEQIVAFCKKYSVRIIHLPQTTTLKALN